LKNIVSPQATADPISQVFHPPHFLFSILTNILAPEYSFLITIKNKTSQEPNVTVLQDATKNVVNVLPSQDVTTTTPTGNSSISTVSTAGYTKLETDHLKQKTTCAYNGF
jgi:hypothetical protein